MHPRSQTNKEAEKIDSKSPEALTPLFHSQAQGVWPFDALCTQNIFSFLDEPDLISAGSVCRLFKKNANEVLLRRLEEFGFDRRKFPKELLAHLPKIIEEFSNALNNPICAIDTQLYSPPYAPHRYIDDDNIWLLSVCRRVKDGTLCLVGAFLSAPANPVSNSNTETLNLYQFMTGVDVNGHVYVRRIKTENTKDILLDPRVNSSFEIVIHKKHKILVALLSKIANGVTLRFQDLLDSIPWEERERSLINDILLKIEDNNIATPPEQKKSSCVIS